MNAEIITIGDEILIGQITDTNSQWIATELNKIGVSVFQITSIQDDKEHILQALADAEKHADIVIITGGLGPTKDDITKHTIASYFNDELVFNSAVENHIKTLFAKYNIPFGKLNSLQAMLPSKATILPNHFGTAAGMWFFENNTAFVSLPGVPTEMKGLMSREVLPKIRNTFNLPYIFHKTVMTYGLGESALAERIEDFEDNLPDFIKLAYLPNFGRVRLRLSAKGEEKDLLLTTLQEKVDELYTIIPDIITGIDVGGAIEKRVGDLLKENNKTIATAESVTGGKIASTLVSVAGASAYFKGSFVTYSVESKIEQLGIPKVLIDEHTVVSKEVAEAMAKAAKEKLKTNFAVAVTGNAGPTTDDTDKTVGVVCIALATDNGVIVEEFNFGKPRARVIDKTLNKSLEMVQKELLKK